jgi:hypothetical protein
VLADIKNESFIDQNDSQKMLYPHNNSMITDLLNRRENSSEKMGLRPRSQKGNRGQIG